MWDGMQNMFPPLAVDQNLGSFNIFPTMNIDNIVIFLKTLSDGYQP
jgi:hypothetical protein